MPNYYKSNYNLITIGEYLNNILSYQFAGLIEVSDLDYTFKIEKDILKDFYISFIEEGIAPPANVSSLYNVQEYSSFDYLIINSDSIRTHVDSYEVMVQFIFDFIHYLDMEECDKFSFVESVLRHENIDLVVKLKRVARNIKLYPIDISEFKDDIDYIEDYRYDDLEL